MISINFFKRPFFSESKLTIFVFLISSIFLVSCGGNSSSSSGGGQEDTGERDLFKDDELLAVTVDMDASDWTDLSYEGRQVTEWAPNCGFPGYNYYYGSVSVNGEDVSNVAVRKKGTIGSLTIFRPSLKINFDKGDGNDGRTFYGNKRITLNNNHQDPSDIKQCLSYSVFDDAGLPTPQCGFSQVTAQQQDLGIYTYVEAIKKPFLRRVFANDDGNLYEG